MYAGRAGEKCFTGSDDLITTGASNDIKQASEIIKQYMFIYGMDEKYGLLNDNLEVVVVPEYDRGLITTDKEFVVLGKKNNLDYNFSVMNFNIPN
jgi:hypothetical protein